MEVKSVVKEWINVFPISNAFHHSKIKCTPAWDPKDGNLLAIPFSKEIKLFQRGLWRELFTLHDYRLSDQVILFVTELGKKQVFCSIKLKPCFKF